MGDWLISSKMGPNFDGGLLENQFIQGGLHIVATIKKRNELNLLERLKNVDTTTLAFVIANKEFYELINEPYTEETQDSDWDLLDFGGSSDVKPIGEWDAAVNEVIETGEPLYDTDALGINGNFYYVANADGGREIQYDGLFRSQTITVYTNDYVMSVGPYFAHIIPKTTWGNLDVPTVITEYVEGTVISHGHAISDIIDLQIKLDEKFDSGDVADHTIDYGSVPDSDIISKIFLDTYFYVKSNTYTQDQVNALIADSESTYAFPGNAGEVILSDGAGDAEAYETLVYDSTNNAFYMGAHTKNITPTGAVIVGSGHTLSAEANFDYGALFGQSNVVAGSSAYGLIAGSGHAITASPYAYVFGEAITVDTGHTMYAPLLRIGQGTGATLTQDDTATQMAVIDDSTGEIKWRDADTFDRFKTWHPAVDNGYSWTGADVVANAVDTMDIVAGANINITTDETLKAIRITAAGSGYSPLTTKGDIYTYDINDQRLAVGTNGQIVIADSAEDTGLKWIDAPYPGDSDGDIQYKIDANTFGGFGNWDGESFVLDQTLTGTSDIKNAFFANITANQSSTAGFTIIKVDVTPTAVGSGLKKLISLNYDSGEKFAVSSDGKVYIPTTLGIGTESPAAPLHVGDIAGTETINPAILVHRNVAVGAGTSAHSFADNTVVSTAGLGYNSFDSKPVFTNAGTIDHYAGFQTKLYLNGAGTVTTAYGFYHNNPLGGGTLTNHYGIYIENLGAGSTINYAIYTAGTTMSVFGGKVRIGGLTAPTESLDVTGNILHTGSTLTFTTDASGSAYHIIDRGGIASNDAYTWYKSVGVSKWMTGIGVSGGEASSDDYRITDGSTTRFKITRTTGAVSITGTLAVSSVAAGTTEDVLVYGASGEIKKVTQSSFGSPSSGENNEIQITDNSGGFTSDAGLYYASNILHVEGISIEWDVATLDLYNEAANTSGEFCGYIDFYGKNSGAAKQQYGRIYSKVTTNTVDVEDGTLTLQVVRNGAMEDFLELDGNLTLINAHKRFQVITPNGTTAMMNIKAGDVAQPWVLNQATSTGTFGVSYSGGSNFTITPNGNYILAGGSSTTLVYLGKVGSPTTMRIYGETNYHICRVDGASSDKFYHQGYDGSTHTCYSINTGGVMEMFSPFILKSYTVATAPTASSYTAALIYVSDEIGGAVPAFSDGTNWRRVTDRTIISTT